MQTIIEHLSLKDETSSQSTEQDSSVSGAQKLFKKFGKRLKIFQIIQVDQSLKN